MNHPCTSAAEVAKLLDSDPIMASQIKEYLSTERICGLLELKKPEADLDDFTDEDLAKELRIREKDRAEDAKDAEDAD